MQETKENPFVLVDLRDGHLKSRQLLKKCCVLNALKVRLFQSLKNNFIGGNCCEV